MIESEACASPWCAANRIGPAKKFQCIAVHPSNSLARPHDIPMALLIQYFDYRALGYFLFTSPDEEGVSRKLARSSITFAMRSDWSLTSIASNSKRNMKITTCIHFNRAIVLPLHDASMFLSCVD
jgi:hypothetical protein